MSVGGISVAGSSTAMCRAKIRATIRRRLQCTASVLRGVLVAQARAASVVITFKSWASR
jgi:protein involved in polysaccharide export with SLBB domain